MYMYVAHEYRLVVRRPIGDTDDHDEFNCADS